MKNSSLGILLLFLQFQTFFTVTPILEVCSCNFLTFLLMFCFLNDESLNCKNINVLFYYDSIAHYIDCNKDLNLVNFKFLLNVPKWLPLYRIVNTCCVLLCAYRNMYCNCFFPYQPSPTVFSKLSANWHVC